MSCPSIRPQAFQHSQQVETLLPPGPNLSTGVQVRNKARVDIGRAYRALNLVEAPYVMVLLDDGGIPLYIVLRSCLVSP